ncbi:MAG: hypothetical protein K0U34_02055 [Alphaproteobacteria bacterium]|nr:hypothetical protein [Alphaproteobacteria bacterium]
MFWRTLGRLILLPIAFLIAVSVTGFILVTLGLEHITHALHGQSDDGAEVATTIVELFWRGSLLMSGLSILPALGVIIVGEVARIRSWLYYMIGGGLALASVPLLSRLGQADAIAAVPAIVWQVFATAGFAGGLVYWLIAGRKA